MSEEEAGRGLVYGESSRPRGGDVATRTEWAHMLENGGAMIWPTREQAEADMRDFLARPRDPFEPRPPASAGIWRREVTEWVADR